MKPVTSLTLAEPPALEHWDFGDFPYGLEPLTLPEPVEEATTVAPPAAPLREQFAETCAGLPGALPRTGPAPRSEQDAHQLYWFRWITGHQVTFVLWQLLAHARNAAERPAADGDGDGAREALLRRMRCYTRAYSAMLLYTSSATPEAYHGLIRPSMFRQHRSFSGTWAPDFDPVLGLLRGRGIPGPGTPARDALVEEVALYHAVHAGVAAKLVPGGRSLLQQVAEDDGPLHPRMQGVLYDNYFMTLRDETSPADVVAQLLRRLVAVGHDVGENGLYPGEPAELPAELRAPAVLACEDEFAAVLRRAADLACGLAPA
jgi:hypothetical protein